MRIVRALLVVLCAHPLFADDAALVAARALFERNLNAIRTRDRDTYLQSYEHAPSLARGGPQGFTTGYDDFAKGAGANWPDTFDASDLHLVSVQPGVVYGTYRYRVRYGAEEHIGISERLFVKTNDGWKIAVTGAIDAPPGTPAPPRAIVGGTVIDGRGGEPLPNTTIVLRDGKIDCIGCPVPDGVTAIDAHGMYVTPGLIV